ncbi:AAA family ATPase [Acidithiobacillus caldus]|uniref:AAA family ATPase n=1 Tax=Acidithiobacillus caldus TaxID=33059 RepID=UPI001C069A26|nr:AAA family ATPase [Acidithiobacillus caldus]MBU2783515.1 AAA family ATPase [Acidithiobacillus caldus]
MRLDDVDIEELLRDAPQQEERPVFPSVSISDLLTNPEPPQRYVWNGRIPRKHCTILGAHGGVGKSVLSLQLAVSVACGLPFLGQETEQGKVLVWSGEDGVSTLRQRLAKIVTFYGIEPESLAENMEALDATFDPTLFREISNGGIREGVPTAAIDYLREKLSDQHALLVVDNASDCFDGDENSRRQVRAFIRSLAKLANEFDLASLLLVHINKQAAEGGSRQNYSGSTSWHNSSRSRLAMVKEPKTNTVILSHEKNNNSVEAPPLKLVFNSAGLLVLDEQEAPDPEEGLGGFVLPEVVVMQILADFNKRGEKISPEQSARNNAWRMLSSEPGFPKKRYSNAASLFVAMRQLERDGLIQRSEYINAHRKAYLEWVLTAKGWTAIGEVAPTAPTAPTSGESALDAGSTEGAPTAPTSGPRGYGGKSAHKVSANIKNADKPLKQKEKTRPKTGKNTPATRKSSTEKGA